MERWWDALLYYIQDDVLHRRWSFSLITLMVMLSCLLIELMIVGWRDSSLKSVFSSKRTDFWDLASILFNFSGFQKVLTNIFFLGLTAYLVVESRRLSWPIFPSAPIWVRIVLAFLIYDFLMYWNHRIRHEWDWFWITHEYHHSSTRVTLLTDFRVHPLDYIVYYPTTALLMNAFFPGDIQDLFGYILISLIPGFIAHSRVDTGFGLLGRYLIVSPRFHHLHHSESGQKFKNYGNFLVIWDRMFGTYVAPSISIHDIRQGLEENPYEGMSPVRAYLRPVISFYKFPFVRLSSGLRKMFSKSYLDKRASASKDSVSPRL